jgi:hypothetical protein
VNVDSGTIAIVPERFGGDRTSRAEAGANFRTPKTPP